MLIAVAVVTAVSIAALIAAVIVGSGLIAWACVGLCVIGLLLVLIDARWAGIKRARAAAVDHTAADELFGEPEVQRDLTREERVVNADMLGSAVPDEEGHRF
jgi:hypothetical protein